MHVVLSIPSPEANMNINMVFKAKAFNPRSVFDSFIEHSGFSVSLLSSRKIDDQTLELQMISDQPSEHQIRVVTAKITTDENIICWASNNPKKFIPQLPTEIQKLLTLYQEMKSDSGIAQVLSHVSRNCGAVPLLIPTSLMNRWINQLTK